MEPPLENLLVDSVTVTDLAQTVGGVREDSVIVLPSSEPQAAQLGVGQVLPQPSDVETPVQRSSRPRMSVTPNLASPPTVFPLPPSGARTQIKKKLSIGTFDESSMIPKKNKRKLFNKHRKPRPVPCCRHSSTRSAISFNRVLGSLFPKSTDLLLKLAFTEELNNLSMDYDEASSNSQTPFTFFHIPDIA